MRTSPAIFNESTTQDTSVLTASVTGLVIGTYNNASLGILAWAVVLLFDWAIGTRVDDSVRLRLSLLISMILVTVAAVPISISAGLFTVFLLDELLARHSGGIVPIRPVEQLSWSWSSMRTALRQKRQLIAAIAVANAVLAALSVTGITLQEEPGLGLREGLSAGLVFGLMYGFGFGITVLLWGGLSIHLRRLSATPNEGIWRSAKTSIATGLGFCFAVTFVLALVVAFAMAFVFWIRDPQFVLLAEQLDFGLGQALQYVLPVSLPIAVVITLITGGYACFQYVIIRVLLAGNRYAPWRYRRFLDYAVERIFLRRVGGSYQFVHRLLLDHFASLAGTQGDAPHHMARDTRTSDPDASPEEKTGQQ